MPALTQQIRQANTGRKILRDWLGEDAVPVPIEQAQARANVCLSCPKNDKGRWVWNTMASALIGARLKLRQNMQITLQGEGNLGVCEVCGCVTKLKISVPLKHLMRYTSHEESLKYPPHCWFRNEYNQATKK